MQGFRISNKGRYKRDSACAWNGSLHGWKHDWLLYGRSSNFFSDNSVPFRGLGTDVFSTGSANALCTPLGGSSGLLRKLENLNIAKSLSSSGAATVDEYDERHGSSAKQERASNGMHASSSGLACSGSGKRFADRTQPPLIDRTPMEVDQQCKDVRPTPASAVEQAALSFFVPSRTCLRRVPVPLGTFQPRPCSPNEDQAPPDGGMKGVIEKRWRDLFSNPSAWWDHRADKVNPRFPDFKHRRTLEGLWLSSTWVPAWVERRLTRLALGAFESSISLGGQERALLDEGKRCEVEKLWLELFSEPSAWQDHRVDKFNPRYPDFRHTSTQRSLWLDSKWTPPWVEAKLAAIPTGALKLGIFSWNKRLSRSSKGGQHDETIELFQSMQRDGINPNRFTFVPVLNACASLGLLEDGRRIHKQIIESGFGTDLFVGSSLVDMYAKCGSIEDARRVFDEVPTKNVVVWNAMILGYVKGGEGQLALELFAQMQQEGVEPSPITFVAALNACASAIALEDGRHVHGEIIRRNLGSNFIISNCLVDMYAKCGSMEDAERVFTKIPKRDVVTWTSMILGYVNCGKGQQALKLYDRMQQEGVHPDPVTLVAVVNACASLGGLEEGRRVHEEIIQRGYLSDVFLGSSLVNMYAKCGSIEDAVKVFDDMPTRDVVAWNAMLSGYGRHGYAEEAMEHFRRMCDNIEVNDVTFMCLLSACNHGGLVEKGLEFFKSMSTVYNISPAVEHYACVVDLLGRAGRFREAEDLIMGMPMEPNASVWMSFLSACRVHGNVEMGESGARKVLQLDRENASGFVLLSNIYAAAGKCDSRATVNLERLNRGE